jgi:hypothetical protein
MATNKVTFLGSEDGTPIAFVEVGQHTLYPNQPVSGVSDAEVKRLKALDGHKFRVDVEKPESN